MPAMYARVHSFAPSTDPVGPHRTPMIIDTVFFDYVAGRVDLETIEAAVYDRSDLAQVLGERQYLELLEYDFRAKRGGELANRLYRLFDLDRFEDYCLAPYFERLHDPSAWQEPYVPEPSEARRNPYGQFFEPIDRLSWGLWDLRVTVPITCFERFCRNYDLRDSDLSAFIEHTWSLRDDFSAWDAGFKRFAYLHDGSSPQWCALPLPEPARLDCWQLARHALLTHSCMWYGGDPNESREYLVRSLFLARKHDIALPRLHRYAAPHSDLWNSSPSSLDEKKMWRSWV